MFLSHILINSASCETQLEALGLFLTQVEADTFCDEQIKLATHKKITSFSVTSTVAELSPNLRLNLPLKHACNLYTLAPNNTHHFPYIFLTVENQ